MKWGRNQSDRNHYLGHSYVYLIASRLHTDMPETKLNFLNRGISGHAIPHLVARWQKDAIDLKPDLLSILIGANDVGQAMRSNQIVDVGAYESGYRSLLAQSREANPELKIVLGRCLFDVQAQCGGRVRAQRIERAGDLARDPRPHDHVVHPGQQGPVYRRQVRHLDLLQIVDAHRPVVPLLGQPDLGEIAQHRQFQKLLRRIHREVGHRSKRGIRRFAALDVVLFQDALRDLGHGKMFQGAAHVASRVAQLQAARQNAVQRRARHHAQLPGLGHGARQAPVRNTGPHSSLDDARMIHISLSIFS